MTRPTTKRLSFGAVFLLAVSLGHAQTLVIPQIADGGGWQTTLVLTNTNTLATTASLSFFRESGGVSTQSWDLTFLEVSSTQNLPLPSGGTLFLHTPGAASATTAGWAQLQASSAVAVYAIFTQRVSGRPDQDGTVPAAASATRVLVPFDNTNGFVTSIAIANPGATSDLISVGLQPSSGAVSQLSPIALPAQGHTAFQLPQQFSATGGQSGLLEFYCASGSFSVLALRFNPTGAFTTAPVYSATGPPIIASSASPGNGALPLFNMITIHADPSGFTVPVIGRPLPDLGINQISVVGPAADGSYLSGYVGGIVLSANGAATGNYMATWNSVTVSGQTLTFNGPVGPSSNMSGSGGVAQITSASLTISMSPPSASLTGTVSGAMTLVSGLAIVSGSFTGTYVAQ
jgi:hypothetical protein